MICNEKTGCPPTTHNSQCSAPACPFGRRRAAEAKAATRAKREASRVLAWVGSRCGVPSPCPDDERESGIAWNGERIGNTEPCVLCGDDRCVARVIDWQEEGDAIGERLVARLSDPQGGR